MSILPERLDYQYLAHELWDKYGDPRTAPYASGGPTWLLAIILAYLAFVLKVGPALMRTRKPFELRGPMKVYNLVNVALNLMFLVSALYLTNFTMDCWGCKDTKPTDNLVPQYLRAFGAYAYLLLKVFDLLDTVFFVLRKKFGQVTPLHVSHHVIMPFTVYIGLRFAPNTCSAHTMIINSFVHCVMYYYYYLAGLGPSGQKHLWIKKYITLIQLIQFVMAFVHAAHLFFNPYCDYPRWISFIEGSESVYFLVTFSKFYLRTYASEQKRKSA